MTVTQSSQRLGKAKGTSRDPAPAHACTQHVRTCTRGVSLGTQLPWRRSWLSSVASFGEWNTLSVHERLLDCLPWPHEALQADQGDQSAYTASHTHRAHSSLPLCIWNGFEQSLILYLETWNYCSHRYAWRWHAHTIQKKTARPCHFVTNCPLNITYNLGETLIQSPDDLLLYRWNQTVVTNISKARNLGVWKRREQDTWRLHFASIMLRNCKVAELLAVAATLK